MTRRIDEDCRHGDAAEWTVVGPCLNCDDHDDDCPNLEVCRCCLAECSIPTVVAIGQQAGRWAAQNPDKLAEFAAMVEAEWRRQDERSNT